MDWRVPPPPAAKGVAKSSAVNARVLSSGRLRLTSMPLPPALTCTRQSSRPWVMSVAAK